MNNKKSSPLGLGITTVITMMVIVSLVVFSTLTFFTAKSDNKFAIINANNISEFYEADAIGKELLKDFSQSNENEHASSLAFGNNKSLNIHLLKNGSEIQILEWYVDVEDSVIFDEELSVWQGD